MLKLAVIGLGNRAMGLVQLLNELESDLRVVAVADREPAAAENRLREAKIDSDGIVFSPDADALLAHASDYDGVLIGTRCNLHAPLAISVAQTGLPLFLEKPVAVSEQQANDLEQAFRGREASVVVSFPLRLTPLLLAAREILQSGRLGALSQVQAFNFVPYGGCYFGQLYRDFEITGGLWLQKATHDFDYLNFLLGAPPISVAAIESHITYGGSLPFDLTCSQCDQTATCPESPANLALRGDAGGMCVLSADPVDHWCAFSEGIRNQDAGSVLIRYAGGIHASYTQNFLTRRGAGSRGARVTGYLGTLVFDWYTNTITVHDHHTDRVDRIDVGGGGSHGGGDAALLRNFLAVMRQEEESRSNLTDGLLSARMCLAARRAAFTERFEPIAGQPAAQVPASSGRPKTEEIPA